jgi:hypothetical protein
MGNGTTIKLTQQTLKRLNRVKLHLQFQLGRELNQDQTVSYLINKFGDVE